MVDRDNSNGSSIRFEGVSKIFSGATRPAVNNVSLQIAPGDFVVLLGPSGCGKTTLLKLVNRLYEPTSGRIFIDDRPTDSLPAPQLRRSIGYVIQQTGLFPHLKVKENIAVVPKLLGWQRPTIDERINELLELVGLSPRDYRDRYPSQLSGGEQQRVGLARALAANPGTLLMDEPFGSLDAITRTRLQEELRLIHARLRQTVLFVTHDIEEAVRLADHIIVMDQGRIVQQDEPRSIVAEPANAFVSDLVGSQDVMRRLSLITVRSISLNPVQPGTDYPAIPVTSDLRSALGLLLESQADALAVWDDENQLIGSINLQTILDYSRPVDVGDETEIGSRA